LPSSCCTKQAAADSAADAINDACDAGDLSRPVYAHARRVVFDKPFCRTGSTVQESSPEGEPNQNCECTSTFWCTLFRPFNNSPWPVCPLCSKTRPYSRLEWLRSRRCAMRAKCLSLTCTFDVYNNSRDSSIACCSDARPCANQSGGKPAWPSPRSVSIRAAAGLPRVNSVGLCCFRRAAVPPLVIAKRLKVLKTLVQLALLSRF
jgi:hypothetical protein